ncbi:MAG: hypothetical protein ABI196_05380 [Bradyrhizobium sp.]
MGDSVLNGNGYSAVLPPAAQCIHLDPFGLQKVFLPAGSNLSPGSPAFISIQPVPLEQVPQLLFWLSGMDNAFIGMMNAQSLGISRVLGVGPARSAPMGGGVGHIREFDGIDGFTGRLYRVTLVTMVGTTHALKLVMGIQIERWAEFMVPCLTFMASISIGQSGPVAAPTLQAIVDPRKRDQVEFRMVNPDRTTAPITAMPLFVGKMEVYDIDQSIRTGNINGVGIAVGTHSAASLS